MSLQNILWLHRATWLYRRDSPENILELIWTAHPGWGFLRGRDMWISHEMTPEEAEAKGYVEGEASDEDAETVCSNCGMRMISIPGTLRSKHYAECCGMDEDWRKIEATMIEERRRTDYERRLIEEKLRQERELLEEEKRERLEKSKEDQLARQLAKDRKRRLKLETRKTLRER